MNTNMINTKKKSTKNIDSALTSYLKDINKIPLLSQEEENNYAKLAQAGDEQAKAMLVNSNLRFVVTVAKKYQNQGLPLMDLISEGNIGLMNAADRFDPSKGYKFISYAVWWIKQAILKALCEKSRMIRLPLNRANELVQIERAKKTMDFGETESKEVNEIANLLNMERGMVNTIMAAAKDPVSIDAPLFDDDKGFNLSNYLHDEMNEQPEDFAVKSTLRDEISKLLESLSDREAQIIKYRFGLDGYEQLSLKEVGLIFNLTKERIRQIEKKAIKQLQEEKETKNLHVYVA